jgi:hypothetical protein
MMMRPHNPAFSLLADFGRPDSAAEERDHEAELKAAFDGGYRQGVSEGRAEAQADAELRLTEADALAAAHLEEQREAWQRDCADALATRFDGAVKQIERSIEDRIATLLRPWLVERLRERAVEDLEKAIARALAEGAKVHIEAPADVLAHLRERLPATSFQIGFSESATPDIRAHIDDTEIEANISAWITELEATAP